MSISRYDRNPGTVFVRLSALVHGPGTSRFAAKPVALSILFGLGFLCALALLFNPRATEAQAHISATLGMGNCLVGGLVASPSVGSGDNYIRGVAAIGPDDAWAVGHYVNASGTNQTLTMHWDGAQWQVVPSPNVGSFGNYLYAVSATPGGEVWAVGHYLTNTQRTLTMRWNGSQWNIVSSPNNGELSNNLRGVSVVTPTDVWAVGFYYSNNNVDRTLTLHWNGNQWDLVPSPDVGPGTNRLFSVSADSAGSAWAVGNYSPSASGSFFTLAMRWDGTQWTISSTPNPGGDYNLLIGVFSISMGNAWAVGFSTDGNNNPHHTLTAHWDGTQWSQVASPDSNLTENYLYSVSGTSSGDVWAAGYAYNRVGTAPSQAVGLHWDGTQWTLASSANSGTTTNTLFGVTALSPGRAIAGGISRSGGTNPLRTFSLLYTSDCSSPTATPATTTPAASPSSTRTAMPTTTSLPSNTPLPGNTPTRTSTPTRTGIPTNTPTSLPTQTPGLATATATPTPPVTSTPTAIPVTPRPSPTPGGTAVTFVDVPTSNTFYPFVQCLARRGVDTGYPCGAPGEPCNATNDRYFRPNSLILRDDLAHIVAASAGFSEPPGTRRFQDVPTSNPYYAWVQRMANRGLIGGYPCGTQPSEPCIGPDNLAYYRPSANATRGQIAKIVSNGAGYNNPPSGQTFEDVPPTQTFYEWVQRLASRGAMGGYPCGGAGEPCGTGSKPYFRWGNNSTRGQAAKITANTFFQGCNTP